MRFRKLIRFIWVLLVIYLILLATLAAAGRKLIVVNHRLKFVTSYSSKWLIWASFANVSSRHKAELALLRKIHTLKRLI